MDSTHVAPAAHIRRTDLLEVAHILVLMQGAVLVAGTIEAVFFLAFAGPASRASLGLTAVAALLTLASAGGLARGSALARHWTIVAEAGVVAVTAIDLILALLMTSEPLGPVPLLAGLVVPGAVIALLRRR